MQSNQNNKSSIENELDLIFGVSKQNTTFTNQPILNASAQQSTKLVEKKLPLVRQRVKQNSRLLPQRAIDLMTEWYDKNYSNPYPSYRDCELLAQAGQITVNQVKQWFVNVRRRTHNQFRRTHDMTASISHKRKSTSSDESSTSTSSSILTLDDIISPTSTSSSKKCRRETFDFSYGSPIVNTNLASSPMASAPSSVTSSIVKYNNQDVNSFSQAPLCSSLNNYYNSQSLYDSYSTYPTYQASTPNSNYNNYCNYYNYYRHSSVQQASSDSSSSSGYSIITSPSTGESSDDYYPQSNYDYSNQSNSFSYSLSSNYYYPNQQSPCSSSPSSFSSSTFSPITPLSTAAFSSANLIITNNDKNNLKNDHDNTSNLTYDDHSVNTTQNYF